MLGRCLGGVLGCLSDSSSSIYFILLVPSLVILDIVWGGAGWGYDVKLIDINPIRVILIGWFLLSQVPRNV